MVVVSAWHVYVGCIGGTYGEGGSGGSDVVSRMKGVGGVKWVCVWLGAAYEERGRVDARIGFGGLEHGQEKWGGVILCEL